MPKVRIPPPYRGPTQGTAEIEVEGAHVLASLEAVDQKFPGFLAQVIDDEGGCTIAAASTMEKDWSGAGGNIEAARKVGALIAERAKEKYLQPGDRLVIKINVKQLVR